MMNNEEISQFIENHFLVSLCAMNSSEIWCANCFYVSNKNDQETMPSLYFMSSLNSKHSEIILSNPNIAGTISRETRIISEIEGVQFKGVANLLLEDSDDYQPILARYQDKFVEAKKHILPIWKLEFTMIKHTSNKHSFGQKSYWNINS